MVRQLKSGKTRIVFLEETYVKPNNAAQHVWVFLLWKKVTGPVVQAIAYQCAVLICSAGEHMAECGSDPKLTWNTPSACIWDPDSVEGWGWGL